MSYVPHSPYYAPVHPPMFYGDELMYIYIVKICKYK